MADDLGYGDIGPYGGWIETPHVEKLAAGGVRFTDFHSSGNVCSPTRAGPMTGLHRRRLGIPGVPFADPARPWRHDRQLFWGADGTFWHGSAMREGRYRLIIDVSDGADGTPQLFDPSQDLGNYSLANTLRGARALERKWIARHGPPHSIEE